MALSALMSTALATFWLHIGAVAQNTDCSAQALLPQGSGPVPSLDTVVGVDHLPRIGTYNI